MRSLLAVMVLVFAGEIGAQEILYEIQLKNGSIIFGTIVEQIPGEYVKVKNRAGDLLVFRMEEVKRIGKVQLSVDSDLFAPPEPDSLINQDEQASTESKSERVLSLGVGYGIGKLAGNTGIQAIAGPDGESFSGVRFSTEFEHGDGFGLKVDYTGYELQKGFLDNTFLNTWNWDVGIFEVMLLYRENLAEKESPGVKVYASIFGGLAFGSVKMNGSELGLDSSVTEGNIDKWEDGWSFGANLEMRMPNNYVGFVVEPKWTSLETELEGDFGKVKLGALQVSLYMKFIMP